MVPNISIVFDSHVCFANQAAVTTAIIPQITIVSPLSLVLIFFVVFTLEILHAAFSDRILRFLTTTKVQQKHISLNMDEILS